MKFAEKFDHVALTPEHFRVTDAEIDEAEALLGEGEKQAIAAALAEMAYNDPNSWLVTD